MPSERKLPHYIQEPPGPWIVVKEHKRSARFRRPDTDTVLLIRVDDGMITSGERADYILAHRPVVDVIVELKGSDVSKAIRQIKATRPVWLGHELCGKKLGALVVRGRGVHPRASARVEQWEREFRKTFKMKLVVESRNCDYEFSEFVLPEASRA
jgi:hypothetical protein